MDHNAHLRIALIWKPEGRRRRRNMDNNFAGKIKGEGKQLEAAAVTSDRGSFASRTLFQEIWKYDDDDDDDDDKLH